MLKKQTLFLITLLTTATFAQDGLTAPDPAGQEPPAAEAAIRTEADPESTPAEAVSQAEPVPEPKPAAETETLRSQLIRVNFEPDGTELTPASAAALDSIAALVAQNARHRYEVHGHVCPDAGAQNHRAMLYSIQRVAAMVNFLLKNGVPAMNIFTIVSPVAGNTAAGECAHDRRVDIMSIEIREREQAAVSDSIPVISAAPAAPAVPVTPVIPVETEHALSLQQQQPPAPDPVAMIPAVINRPTLAIYMAGAEPQGVRGVHNILGGELARTISESEKYLAVDRTNVILEALAKEHVYQRSGAVSDDEIKDLGKQLGANYLCISNINSVEGKRSYYLDMRLVDVVTAQIIRTVTANSTLRDANEMTKVARSIAFELIETEKARAQRLRRKKILRYTSLGLDVLGAGALMYGYIENSNVVQLLDAEDYPEADRVATRRDAAYTIGGALLASGITIHIFF